MGVGLGLCPLRTRLFGLSERALPLLFRLQVTAGDEDPPPEHLPRDTLAFMFEVSMTPKVSTPQWRASPRGS